MDITILSISLQLAGALILLLWSGLSVNEIKEKAINMYFPGSNFAKRDDNNMITLELHKLRKQAKIIIKNIFAFAFLSIGYFLSIFSTNSNDVEQRVRILLFIVCTIILIILSEVLSYVFSCLIFKNDVKIDYDKTDGIDTAMTSKELQDLYKKAYEDVFHKEY